MKLFKQFIAFILTLSLSANILCHTAMALDLSFVDDENIINDDYNNSIDSSTNDLNNDYVEVFSENNQLLYISQDDINLMAQVVYAESRGEPFNGKVAVASVIINRVLSSSFPNTIKEVIYQPYAFSCIKDGKITVTPSQDCIDAVYEAIRGCDPTGDALYFYNPETATCSWMQDIEKCDTTSIGNHLFFSLAY